MSRTTPAGAQTWNDPRTRALVTLATTRRSQQLADTGLADYRATAHGYVTFLAQLGEGFLTPPKLLKADELALEVYWRAPNLSKQRIIGRRDTLLLPTDIQYHRDHLGIVQNNFPNIIRIGEGDEVADVPHPLSPAGMNEYDFAISDSLPIQFPGGRVTVYEIKVRPKDERSPRVIGAVYVDPAGGQVVRMAFNFTRAAFLDKQLEGLEITLENGLVGTRFWLPRRQEIEIRRSGTWLDYPVRGIIRGRWEISNYELNIKLPAPLFTGPEIVIAPRQELAQYHWQGQVLDALPPDIRAATDPNVAQVQEEARRLVTAQALARVHSTTMSARGASDFVRFNRVEGLALGSGITGHLGAGVSITARARYGLDDQDVKGTGVLAWQHPSGSGIRAFGFREYRDVGDLPERSIVLNSIAAQEFGSDYTDPYFVRGGGLGFDFPEAATARWHLDASLETQRPLTVNATPVVGRFQPVVPAFERTAVTIVAAADRAPRLWYLGTELTLHAQLRATFPRYDELFPAPIQSSGWDARLLRPSMVFDLERPFGNNRLVVFGAGAVLFTPGPNSVITPQDLTYYGGPTSAPGYDYHALQGRSGVTGRVEWRTPVPFPSFSLGRFGRVPARATIAPFLQGAAVDWSQPFCAIPSVVKVFLEACPFEWQGYPTAGVGILSPFEFLRLDVARGLRVGRGRWTFSIDVSREYWTIL